MDWETLPPYVATWGADDAAHIPFTVSNDLLPDREALRRRMREHGYLFLRGLLEPARLLALRGEILDVCRRHGWLRAGHDPMDGVADDHPRIEGQEAYFAANDDIQRLERFHALSHHPALLDVMTRLVDEPLLTHPLSVSRLMFPGNTPHSTPPHQDHPNNQGTQDIYAVWIPLGDCSRTLGSLAVLQGSHRFGVLPLRRAMGAGYRTVVPSPALERLPWASSDFHAGDVLIFHGLTVHRALPNRSPDRLRVSVDYRYQNAREPISDYALLPHFRRLTWDDVYAGWASREHQYYWRAMDLTVVPYDPSEPQSSTEHEGDARPRRAWARTMRSLLSRRVPRWRAQR